MRTFEEEFAEAVLTDRALLRVASDPEAFEEPAVSEPRRVVRTATREPRWETPTSEWSGSDPLRRLRSELPSRWEQGLQP